MTNRAKSFRSAQTYRELGQQVSGAIAKNFDAQGRPRWKPRKYNYSWPILDKTGLMRDAAELTAMEWQHRGDIHTNKITGPHYSNYHQHGTQKLPVRKFVDFLPQEVTAFLDMFRKLFLKQS